MGVVVRTFGPLGESFVSLVRGRAVLGSPRCRVLGVTKMNLRVWFWVGFLTNVLTGAGIRFGEGEG